MSLHEQVDEKKKIIKKDKVKKKLKQVKQLKQPKDINQLMKEVKILKTIISFFLIMYIISGAISLVVLILYYNGVII